METEYADHVATVPTHARRPSPSEPTPPVPAAISPTPASETAAASQNPELGRSNPAARAYTPTKIGVVPSTSPSVDALVRCAAVTKQNWLRKIRNPESATSFPSERRI